MSPRPKNLLFLSIDAFRADRAGFLGYQRPTTPNLDRLCRNAVICSQTLSTAAFTQAAVIGMFTSTPPLSLGGYDQGGFGRPDTVFKAFHDAGHEVTLLSSFKWITRFFGYGEGVDHEHHFFSPKDLVGASLNRMKSALQAYHRGNSSADEALVVAGPVIVDLFAQLRHYCDDRLRDCAADKADFGDTRLIGDGWNYPAILSSIDRHERAFQTDPKAYLDTHLHYIPKSHQWISAEWRYCRIPSKLVGEALFQLGNRLLRLVNPSLARLRHERFKQFVDGAALANRLIRILRQKAEAGAGGRPFVLYSHFLDAHTPYFAGRGRDWYRRTLDYLRALGYDPAEVDVSIAPLRPETEADKRAWSALYDAALRYADEQIGRVLDEMERLGLADDTLVVVCGDHGEELCEHGNISHYFRLHDHNVRVPMIFANPRITPARVDGLTTLMDLAPTVCALAGVAAAPGWEGKVVTDPAVQDRDHVVLETFYGGNCMFEKRPLYMAVRTRTHKFIWKEYMDPDDKFGPEGNELYDVVADPLEQNNLYRPDHPLVKILGPLIAQRLAQIPQVAASRWQPLIDGLEAAE